jgi:5-formyltetrahydrofolate cyclo-ligase
MSKQQIREQVLKVRRSVAPGEIMRLSDRITRRLLSSPEFQSAKVVASYVAKEDEAQTQSIIEEAVRMKKRVLVPRTDPATLSLNFSEITSLGELAVGTFGILEPPAGRREVPLSDADLILVPVVAWDSKGNRVGYGKGYFDRELKSRGDALVAGLAFEFQKHDIIPTNSEDVKLDMLVTESQAYRFGRDAN